VIEPGDVRSAHRIASRVVFPAWVSDGTILGTLLEGDRYLVRLTADGRVQAEYHDRVGAPFVSAAGSPISPDGAVLLYEAWERGVKDRRRRRWIRTRELRTGSARTLVSPDHDPLFPFWTGSRGRIAYVQREPDGDAWICSTDGRQQRRVYHSRKRRVFAARAAPGDGGVIYLWLKTRSTAQQEAFWRLTLGSGSAAPIHVFPHGATGLSVAQDGRAVLLAGRDSPGPYVTTYLFSPKTGALRKLFGPEKRCDGWVAVSPDSGRLAGLSRAPGATEWKAFVDPIRL
jgi:hypothetical protein